MKRTLTFIFGLILMVAPFVPTPSIADAPSTVTVSGQYTINGIIMNVTSPTPTPLLGATIAIPGTNYGTISDANGKFKFMARLDAEHITLVITYVGWTNPRINLQEYCNTEETKAKCNHTAKTIDIGTIELREESHSIDVVVKVFDINCPRDTLNSLNAKKGMMIKNDDGTQAPCLPTECNQNYILMNSITYDKITSTTQYGTLKAANPKCVPESNCHTKNTGIKSSRYELQSNNKYQCIAECHDGYAPNTQDPSTCEKVPDCTNEIANAKRAEYTGSGTNRKCVVKECKCGFDVNSDKTGCTTWDSSKCSNRTKIRGAKRMQRFCDNETEVCTAIECDTDNYKRTEVTDHNYSLPSNISKLYTCEEHAKQCTDEQLRENAKNLQHASKSKPITNTTKTDGSQICIPTKCECGYDLTAPDTPDAKCTEWGENELCLERPENAADNQYFRRCRNNQEYCYINDCTDGYLPNEDNDRCVLDRKSGECTPDNNNNVRYAKWRKKNGKYVCFIIECIRGYERNAAGTECIAKMVLPEDKSAERINELQDVYNEAKGNETSTANKLLGGASMGATGAGGMMLGMGLAEQKADNAAYEKMRGYVSTFKCNYGGNNVEYSVEPTQLPTSTELTNLYAEYVTLANDLKMRKSALGLRAGLESQPILDSATSGLYDDVSSGRAAGTFTSLARAILDPNGEDAKRWAEQTKKSKNLIIAGGVTAGVGAVGGIVGNVLINKDAPNLQSVREKIDDINKRYAEFYKEFERVADDLNGTVVVEEIEHDQEKQDPMGNLQDNEERGATEESDDQLNDLCKSCPRLISTGSYPSCICREINKKFNKMTCQCEDVIVTSTEAPRVYSPVSTSGPGFVVGMRSGDLRLTPTNITLSIPGSTLFATNKYDIKDSAKDSLRQLIHALRTLNGTLQQESYDVIVTGHTDTEGGRDSRGNRNLSQRRADTVGNFLYDEAQRAGLTLNITPSGKAGTECTCASGLTENSTEEEFSKRRQEICKEVEVSFTTTTCCEDATDYAAAERIVISDHTKFEPCRRVDITFTLPTTEAGSLARYGIDGIGDRPLTMADIQRLADQATAGIE